VLFTVKSYDTRVAGEACRPLIGDNTAVVSLQNGVDNEDTLAALVGEDHVMGGVAKIFSTIQSPGHVVHTHGPADLVFGELDGSTSERGVALLHAFREAGVNAVLSNDIRLELWAKWAFICAQAGMTAATQLPIGEIRSVNESRRLFVEIAQTVTEVAHAEGIELPADMAERCMNFADALEASGRSSLYHDMRHGKRMELEALLGHLSHKAAEFDISSPAVDVIFSLLRPWAVRNANE
jgi:2-dehydropantoate 2-reductase